MTGRHFVNVFGISPCRQPERLRHVALRMTAVAGFHLDAVFVGVLARLTAILFDLYLGGQRAVA
jgi:hypothetical protein